MLFLTCLIKDVETSVAAEVVDYRVCRDRVKGSAWQIDEVKGAVEEKKEAYRKMLEECIRRSKCEEEYKA